MALYYPVDNTGQIINYSVTSLFGYIMTVYVFCKVQSIKLRVAQLIYVILSGFLLTFLFVCVRLYNYPLSFLLRFILIPLLLSVLIKEQGRSFKIIVIGYVSLASVTFIKLISGLVIGTIIWVVGIIPSGILVYLPIEIIAFIISVLFMKIKRFKRGIQFFQEDKNLGLGLAISSIVMILKCMNLRENQEKNYMFIVFIVGIIIAGFGLYLWIRRSITAHYRERLQLKSEDHYKELLEERDKEIEKLNQSNEYLAKIVHRDNHLMSALDASVDAYFYSDDESKKDELLREIQTLAKERGELIAKDQIESKVLSSTGNHLIDASINDLYIKAAAHSIDFNLTVSATVDEIIGKFISQTDLQTLLSDHIKDAIIAVDSRGEAGGKILVNLSMKKENYCIDIYDNGVEFDINTLSKLGLERVTTHADTGGSGIGFMTTFETLRKAYASLIITEFENKTPFTKSVSFRFDGENAYIIHSYRSEELKKNINRADLVIDN